MTDPRIYTTVTHDVERIEYPCRCQNGVYRFAPNDRPIDQHDQLPHRCTHCAERVYFTVPYPALRYRDRVFVDWQTLRQQVFKA